MSSTPVLRQHCPDSVLRWINTRECWHLDVWLHEYDGTLWLHVQTSAGGHKVIGRAYFRFVRDEFGLITRREDIGMPPSAKETHLNAPSVLKAWGVQWGHVWHTWISPLAGLWPRGDYRRRSIAFHCVKPVGVVDPCEGTENTYSETGRAERDVRHGAKVRKY